jgi:hypothetical protein
MKNLTVLLQMIEQPIQAHQPVILHHDGPKGRPSFLVGSLRNKISDQYMPLVRIKLQRGRYRKTLLACVGTHIFRGTCVSKASASDHGDMSIMEFSTGVAKAGDGLSYALLQLVFSFADLTPGFAIIDSCQVVMIQRV